MLRCCIICRAETWPDQYCSVCQSALYCSEACQRKDWNKRHKHICKLLNVGHGYMQLRDPIHVSQSIDMKEQFETHEQRFDEDTNRFFKLFQESTFEGSQAAAREMKKFAKRLTKQSQKFLLFHSVNLLIRSSNSEMLSWPNSPLFVLLQFVDPNVLHGDKDAPLPEDAGRATPLHVLANLADPSDYSTHENQLILAKQLIEHGANVNAVSFPRGSTPLHHACHAVNVTNLEFVELLLEAGADPNAQDYLGLPPLMFTTPGAPGAAKFLLNWPTTDANITNRFGASFPTLVRMSVKGDKDAIPAILNQVQLQFLVRQWREIEEMLVGRGANNTRINAL
jgi:hypothetical protein